jgi:hypothetical protein
VVTPQAPAPEALGESPIDGGFRRVSRSPEPLTLARLRVVLLDVAGAGPALLKEGLEGFQSWRCLATLCGSAWTTGVLQDSRAARRVLLRRLRVLGTHPIAISRAATLPVGSVVHVRGTIRSMPRSRLIPHIWSHSAMNTDNVRLLVEQGHDFFLTDDAGETTRVIATRGYLINGDELAPGDRVSVFGFADRVADPRAQSPELQARGALSFAVRAGDELPLLIRRL